MRLDPEQLRTLSVVVEAGTFDEAARRLSVTPSAVSQRIKALEVAAGLVLVTRTKPVAVTPSGRRVLRLARQLDALAAEIERELGSGSAATDRPVPIAIATNADSLATWLLPALAGCAADGVVFDLHRADQDDTAALLRDGTVQAAVTSLATAVPGCRVTRLGRMPYRPTAATAFAARWFPDGAGPDRLAVAPVVVFDRSDRLQERYLRRAGRSAAPPVHYVPDSTMFLDAVRRGLGWGMLPDVQTRSYRDELVVIDPEGTADVVLYWQQWRSGPAALDAVAAAVRATAGSVLDTPWIGAVASPAPSRRVGPGPSRPAGEVR